ncbi:nose resistant to fluoxetine protein 6-like isoform X3 [Scylla paramamosain]|uniref:nose resistant to fluoxetine protein 6-like isoform X3 n=1 Tax=Scylla paramamosain TaxID=85552 RepID=UPI003083D3F3
MYLVWLYTVQQHYRMLTGLLLLLLLLCGAGRGADSSLNMALEYVQQTAAENAVHYLPVAVSPTSPCGRALSTMVEDLQRNLTWPAFMMDSWGKNTDGILSGNKYNGLYDECVTAASPDSTIKGKYCRIHPSRLGNLDVEATFAHQQLPLGRAPGKLDFSLVREWAQKPRMTIFPEMEYGTCMPNVCTKEELQDSLAQYLVPTGVFPAVIFCEEQDTDLQFTDGDIGFVTLSMTWVIWCHQSNIPFPNTANILQVFQKFESILGQTLLNGYPSVDTFFFLSGLLLSYSVLKETKRTRSFNIFLFYSHRILRIVPAIGIMCGFQATVMRFFLSGPLSYVWNMSWQTSCAKNWWKDVTFVNNFIPDGGSCLPQTWYIAADMQMYLVAPLIILPLYFYEDIGKAWLLLLTALSAIIPAAIIYDKNLPPTTLISIDLSLYQKYFNLVYLPPWTRASPWLAGVWVGYIFFKQGNTRYKMSPLVVTVGWTLAAITGLLVVFGMYSYNHFISPTPYELMSCLTYGGLHRLAWGAALSWLVFACHNGYGGVVNGFLSHPVWQPISRLTYATYLVAFPVQYFLFYNSRDVYYFTHINTIISTVGAVVIAIGGALLLSLMAESPIVGLEKILLRPNHGSSPRKPAVQENVEPHVPTNGVSNPAFMTENIITTEKTLEASKTVTAL